MNNSKFLFLVFFVLLSCNKGENKNQMIKQSEPVRPTPDYSTPDKLVKSYWSYSIWQDTTYDSDTSQFNFLTSNSKQKIGEKYFNNKISLKKATIN